MRRMWLVAVPVITLAAAVAGCGGSSSVKAVSSTACGPVEYDGAGKPNTLIVSDLPLRNPSAARAEVLGIRSVLAQRHYRAGAFRVAYQSCDDSTARADHFDPVQCAANAHAYAADASVLGVIGPYNSPCAETEVPVLEQAPDGGVAQIGTATTDPALTSPVPGVVGAPGIFYPKRTRNFVRLAAPDQFQPAAAVLFAHRLHVRRLYVLDDGEGYGQTLAGWLRADVRRSGLRLIVGSASWNPKAKEYGALAARVAASHPDGVYLSGYSFLHGTAVLKALHAAIPGRSVVYIAPDGFSDPSDDVKGAGAAADGLYFTLAGVDLQAEGYGRRYGAAAASVLLDAIAQSDGSRRSVIVNVFKAHTPSGLIGRFGFDREGDPTVGAIGVFRLDGKRIELATTEYPTVSFAKG